MKHLLILFVLLPVFAFAQENTGTLMVRKNEPLMAYTSIAGITKGKIHINKIATKPILELNSNKPGKIVSFEIMYSWGEGYSVHKSESELIAPDFIKRMKKHKPLKFYIEKIVAQIDGKEVKLPLFSLQVIY